MSDSYDRLAMACNGVMRCKYRYDKMLVAALEKIPLRVYNPVERCFDLPMNEENFQRLEKLHFHFDAQLKKMFRPATRMAKLRIPKDFRTPNWKVMFPYQREGVFIMCERKGRALLADDMGLGKTLQIIEYIQYKKKLPAVIVAPGCLKYNWKDEFKTWAPHLKVMVLEGRNNGVAQSSKSHRIHPFAGFDVVLINYDILEAWLPTILEWKPLLVAYDEAHYLKNDGTKRTEAAKQLSAACRRVICATGTPVENNPMDLYNLVNMINPKVFPSKYQFGIKYCQPSENFIGEIQFKGCSNANELHTILSETVMIRRKKEDVLTQLPPKIFTIVHSDLNKQYRSKYNDLHKGIVRDLDGVQSSITAMAKIEKMKQLLAEAKVKQVIDWVEEYLTSGKKFVLFCTHHATVDAFVSHFKKRCVQIDGRVPNDARMKAMKAFQEDPKVMVLVGNVQAAGKGWTFTAASGCGMVEYPWKPAELNQAVDRLHRIGQLFMVNAYLFACADTIDEDIIDLLRQKQTTADQVVDGAEAGAKSIYDELVRKLKERRRVA